MLIKQMNRVFAGFLVLFAINLIFPQTLLAQVNPNAEVESKVRASFPDMPVMIEVAKCESGYRQFLADGTPLRGGTSKRYIGIFQIDEVLHRQNALNMAFDINTIDGNIAYARHMYFKSGSNPWKGCLSTSPVPAPIKSYTPSPSPVLEVPVTSTGAIITTNLNYGMNNSQVLNLQQILNKSGFVIAASGPGSVGNETTYFGSMTREAVKRLQCAKNIVCAGNESTTGYGMVGPKTRAVLGQ